jgi:hypothetical protein
MTRRGWVLLVIAAVLTALYEASFMPFLPSPWHEVRPMIQVSVLLVVLNRTRGALVYAGIAGLLLDLFRVDAGTFALGRMIAVTMILLLLSETVLTNRSIYATGALVFAGRIADALWIWIAHAIGSGIFHLDIRIEPIQALGIVLLWDVGLLSLAFMALALFTRRFLVTISRGSRL